MQQGRPPAVRFEQVAIEDRNASISAGRKIYRDENHVFVRQQGSHDEVEKNAEEWLAQKNREAMEDKFPPQLAEAYQKKYEMWLKGVTVMDGTPLKECPSFSKAEVLTLAGAGVHSLEDLAELPEAGLQNVGIGSRELRERARDLMKAANGPGKLAEEMNAMRVAMEAMKVVNDSIKAENATLLAHVDDLKKSSDRKNKERKE